MRIDLFIKVLVLVTFVSFTPTTASADAPAGKGSVKGKVVYPDGTAGVGVSVQLMARERAQAPDAAAPAGRRKGPKTKGEGAKATSVAEAIADQSGEFAMADVAAGRYVVVCRLKGVGAARQPVSVSADSTASVTLKLVARDETKKPGKAKKPGKVRKAPAARNQAATVNQ